MQNEYFMATHSKEIEQSICLHQQLQYRHQSNHDGKTLKNATSVARISYHIFIFIYLLVLHSRSESAWS